MKSRKQERHGKHGTRVYRIWQSMKQRCYYKKHKFFRLYGGRGISICEAWRSSFSAFYRDMGDPPSNQHQIDRLDNDGNYEPGNCRWVFPAENLRHRSFIKLTSENVKEIWRMKKAGARGKDIAEHFGVNPRVVSNILRGRRWQDLQAAAVADVVEAAR